jgi:hypothetical protein
LGRYREQGSLPQLPFVDLESGRKAAAGGKRLPLFWHCRLADARKAPVYGLLESGTTLAISIARTFWSPKGFRHEHQLR